MNDKCEYLIGEEMLPSDQSQTIEETFSFRKSFSKANKNN